ncbi:MAG: hypothetical protein N2Z59_04365 [Alteraurantiacibacter sp.]|nr:hypothetical protein [Alteraurantiacibacter sp.]
MTRISENAIAISMAVLITFTAFSQAIIVPPAKATHSAPVITTALA